MSRIEEIQQALRTEGLDGWLFFDHHRRDPLAYRVLRFEPGSIVSRRWYYLIPAEGEPRGLVHKIEAGTLNPLPGRKTAYAGWMEQKAKLGELLGECRKIAMQYSPECGIPYVATVDAGTVELVRDCGADVRSSADLVQYFEARWDAAMYDSHIEAGTRVDSARRAAFAYVSDALRSNRRVTEYEVQQLIRTAFRESGLFTDHGPIVAVNANASDPHYEPSPECHSEIKKGDLLLIDMWAKLDRPGSAYYDITWTGFCGQSAPDRMKTVFEAVTGARDAAVALVKNRAEAGAELGGFEVDDCARGHLRERGYAEYFFHRTGHSIGEEVHGNGANMDNFETNDRRRIIPGTCFSVEPGVYLSDFGIRSEVNVYRGETAAEVTGEIQTRLLELLA
jgi:Xaa-Pro aminopeptidase